MADLSWKNLAGFREKLTANPTLGPEVCAAYLLLHLHSRHPLRWLSSPRNCDSGGRGPGLLHILDQLEIDVSRSQRTKLAEISSLKELFRHFYFRGVVLDSHEGLVGWLEGRYPLRLRLDLPTPDEMLAIQCEGLRYVSVLLDSEIQFKTHGRFADACDFMLHDFEHAHKFYADTHVAQVRFFRLLKNSLPAFKVWEGDPLFVKDLDYLKSDMNSHPVHLIKYLKAVVLNAEMRSSGSRYPELDGFWQELFENWEIRGSVMDSALKINYPERETESDLIKVSEFFHAH